MNIVKAEQYQDKVYILDAGGVIWRFEIGPDGQPLIYNVHRVAYDQIAIVGGPRLQIYDETLR